jgi:hypothetical protein
VTASIRSNVGFGGAAPNASRRSTSMAAAPIPSTVAHTALRS